MLIEICVEYKRKIIFSAIFDTSGGRTIKEFRVSFNNRFAVKYPRISREGPDIRETWRQILDDPLPSVRTAPRRDNSARLL